MKTTLRLTLALGCALTALSALASHETDDASHRSSRPAEVEQHDEEKSKVQEHEKLALEVPEARGPVRADEDTSSRKMAVRQDPFDRSMDAGG